MKTAIFATSIFLFITVVTTALFGPAHGETNSGPLPPRIVETFKRLVRTGALTPSEAAMEMKHIATFAAGKGESSSDRIQTNPGQNDNENDTGELENYSVSEDEMRQFSPSRAGKPQPVYNTFVQDLVVKGHSKYSDNTYKHNFGSYPLLTAIVERDGRWYYEPAALGISIRGDHEKIEIDNPNNGDVKVHMFLYKLTY
ncbi:MAG: hypothetical protein CVV64_07065 [Candidatus Wallbacteria bacterium HGW-Wallbacteria-1]|jgi:hypothetical protein|uniref:Uncharacterized protein n=1 Tax=Candidatus Wallbacteria bacterium HGW-Wallbacteria-1 TaxID=2013854 RepID=A0A2N1PT42_9BACT|nr:MAG: hypothetical protein CVV64_07065 [Candidatus Wallbacteria bacterium HGW-Wallbacteria-1]